MKLSDFLYPDIKAARSVNIERDGGSEQTIDDYIITSKGIAILERFATAMNGERVSAWSLSGPYGMGKSSFINYLLSLTGNPSSPITALAQKKLQNAEPELAKTLIEACNKKTNGKGFLQVSITASYEPINQTLLRGLSQSLADKKRHFKNKSKRTELIVLLEQMTEQKTCETRTLVDIYIKAQKIANVPLMIVIDEFGKNLEYMAHHPDMGDIYVLQMLAEAERVFLWVCLHQAFDDYARGLTTQQRIEWAKVQGRFEDISFVETPQQMIALMKRVLIRNDCKQIALSISKWAEQFEKKIIQRDGYLNGSHLDKDTIASLYPLHPLTVIVLPELCRRFAQNDRTLFSFLCGGDPLALPHFLNMHTLNNNESGLPLLGLDRLYDFFFSISTTSFIDRAESQRWIEIQDIIRQETDFDDRSLKILKTIGILNLISGPQAGLKANSSMIQIALDDNSEGINEIISRDIKSLTEKRILIFREYAQEYRLWEGTDFDIVEALRDKKATIALRPLEEVLQNAMPLTPITAARHAYDTGTVRRFESRWISLSELTRQVPSPQEGFDGLLVYSFGTAKKIEAIPSECPNGKPLLVAYSPQENQISELALEAAAAQAVLQNAPELVRDGVARKEARYRAQAAADQLRTYIEQIYAPGSISLQWNVGHEHCFIRSYRDLSSVISDRCDEAYKMCPPIKMEMINYDNLSPAAARARRELAEAMVAHQQEKNLGMSGFGPEVAIYRALFLSTGLHKEQSNGQWQFAAPVPESAQRPLWESLSSKVKEADSEGVSVAELCHQLKKPPYGLREGVIPLYICHFLLVNVDEMALFQEGIYKPYFDDAEIALMMKRPELFIIRRFAPVGLRRKVFESYLSILNTVNLSENSNLRNPTLLSVVGPLVQFIDSLPTYSRLTRSISIEAQRVRAAILHASDPINLLLNDLPVAVGMPIEGNTTDQISNEWKSRLQKQIKYALQELISAFDKLYQKVETLVMKAFQFEGGIKEFYDALRERVKPISASCHDEDLNPILEVIMRDTIDYREWMSGIAGRILKHPLDSWHDSDIDPFAAAIKDYAERIEQLEALVYSGIGSDVVNEYTRVISVTETSGKMERHILRPSQNSIEKAREYYAEHIEKMTEEERQALIVILSDEIMNGKKSQHK